MYSGGRDNVVIIWNSTELTKTKTIPVYDVCNLSHALFNSISQFSYVSENSASIHEFVLTA